VQLKTFPGFLILLILACVLDLTMLVKTYQGEGLLNNMYAIYFFWILAFSLIIAFILIYSNAKRQLATVEDF